MTKNRIDKAAREGAVRKKSWKGREQGAIANPVKTKPFCLSVELLVSFAMCVSNMTREKSLLLSELGKRSKKKVNWVNKTIASRGHSTVLPCITYLH
jgi:hypothetical protein